MARRTGGAAIVVGFMTTSRWRRTALGGLAVVLLLVMGGAALWTLQRQLIYFPDRSVPDLGSLGSSWEQVGYETDDGLTLHGWYRVPEPGLPVVIVFNGNAGNRGGRVALGAGLAGGGLGVLLTDYRGYAENPGQPDEEGLAKDARAAAGFVKEQTPGSAIVYFGESLGAAVAVELAIAEPPCALVLRSPFTSLVDVGQVHYSWLPVSLFLKDRYPSIERIASVASPVLVIAGASDSIVPIEQSRALFSAAPEPRRFHVVSDADHNDADLVAGREMIEKVRSFIDDVCAR